MQRNRSEKLVCREESYLRLTVWCLNYKQAVKEERLKRSPFNKTIKNQTELSRFLYPTKVKFITITRMLARVWNTQHVVVHSTFWKHARHRDVHCIYGQCDNNVLLRLCRHRQVSLYFSTTSSSSFAVSLSFYFCWDYCTVFPLINTYLPHSFIDYLIVCFMLFMLARQGVSTFVIIWFTFDKNKNLLKFESISTGKGCQPQRSVTGKKFLKWTSWENLILNAIIKSIWYRCRFFHFQKLFFLLENSAFRNYSLSTTFGVLFTIKTAFPPVIS